MPVRALPDGKPIKPNKYYGVKGANTLCLARFQQLFRKATTIGISHICYMSPMGEVKC